MLILSSYQQLVKTPMSKPRVVVIGNFDGFHQGHRRLLETSRNIAERIKAEWIVLTFSPHPHKVLRPHIPFSLITTELRKQELIAACGPDVLIEEPFDQQFSAQSPTSFVDQILVAGLKADHVVVGANFSFGHGRAGTPMLLTDLLKLHGVMVSILPPVSVTDKTTGETWLCSSSQIRKQIQDGQVTQAALLLGRPFELEGVVVAGMGRGQTIGIPTANLQADTELLPKIGVYAAWAEILEHRTVKSRHQAAVNIGYRPTFTEPGQQGLLTPSIEAHLILSAQDQSPPSFYGQYLKLNMMHRLRDEQKFPNVDELIRQIQKDIQATKQHLENPV